MFSFWSQNSTDEGTVRAEEAYCEGSVKTSEGKSPFVEK